MPPDDPIIGSVVRAAVLVTPGATPLILMPKLAVSNATFLIIIWTILALIDINGDSGSGKEP